MNSEAFQIIQRLAADSFKNLADHAFQGEVNSPYLKRVKDNISEMERICLEDTEDEKRIISQRDKLQDDKTDLLKIVYAMSRFDYPILNSILDKSFNQTQAFNYLERITGVKSTTLKNMRDRFDPYVTQESRAKQRKGWHQVDLLPEYEAIRLYYQSKDKNSIMQEIAEILHSLRK